MGLLNDPVLIVVLESHPHRTAVFAKNPREHLRDVLRHPFPLGVPLTGENTRAHNLLLLAGHSAALVILAHQFGNLHVLVVIEYDFRRPSHSVVKRRRQSRIADGPRHLGWPVSESECSIDAGGFRFEYLGFDLAPLLGRVSHMRAVLHGLTVLVVFHFCAAFSSIRIPPLGLAQLSGFIVNIRGALYWPTLIPRDVFEQVSLRREGQFFAPARFFRDSSCVAVPVERFADDGFYRPSQVAPLAVGNRTPLQELYWRPSGPLSCLVSHLAMADHRPREFVSGSFLNTSCCSSL